MANRFCFSKNDVVPKRSISPESFDAILSELGDDPVMAQTVKRNGTAHLESHAMNRHSYEADASLLSKQFPRPDAHSGELPRSNPSQLADTLHRYTHQYAKPAWIGVAICILALASFNTYLLLELRTISAAHAVAPDAADHAARELQELILDLKADLLDNHEALTESLETLLLQRNRLAHANSSSPGSIAKISVGEQLLKRWRYLGMSESTTGIKGFFNTGEGIQTLSLNSVVASDWRLSSVTPESASFISSNGKTLAIHVSKDQ
jgi:hypothetical protein